MSFMTQHERDALDRHITGNYGEDQFRHSDMPIREWRERRTCPACGWSGEMEHEEWYDEGIIAYCDNPDHVDGDVDDAGHMFGIYCGNNDGFIVKPEGTPE